MVNFYGFYNWQFFLDFMFAKPSFMMKWSFHKCKKGSLSSCKVISQKRPRTSLESSSNSLKCHSVSFSQCASSFHVHGHILVMFSSGLHSFLMPNYTGHRLCLCLWSRESPDFLTTHLITVDLVGQRTDSSEAARARIKATASESSGGGFSSKAASLTLQPSTNSLWCSSVSWCNMAGIMRELSRYW